MPQMRSTERTEVIFGQLKVGAFRGKRSSFSFSQKYGDHSKAILFRANPKKTAGSPNKASVAITIGFDLKSMPEVPGFIK